MGCAELVAMSLILDALQRAQQEPRLPGDVPGVATAHLPEDSPQQRWQRALPWTALALALVALAWLLVERAAGPATVSDRQNPGPVAAQMPAARHAKSPAEGTDDVTERKTPQASTAADSLSRAERGSAPAAAARSVPAVPREAPDPAVAALYQRGAAPPQKTQRDVDPAVGVEPSSGTDSVAAVETGRRAQNTTQSATGLSTVNESDAARPPDIPESPALDIDALVATAESVLAQQSLIEHPAPFLSELSQADKDAIPTVYYSKHDYIEGGRSSVVLNSKVLEAGDKVGGLNVDEVLSDSVVLSHHGIQFRLKALNSWVNL